MYYNKVIEGGFLTKDPELRYLPTGTAIGSFTLAVQDRVGEKKETCFIDVTLFGKIAETICKYLKKGSNVLVEGRLQLQTWESNGQSRRKHQIIGSRVVFINRVDDTAKEAPATTTVPPDLDPEFEPF